MPSAFMLPGFRNTCILEQTVLALFITQRSPEDRPLLRYLFLRLTSSQLRLKLDISPLTVAMMSWLMNRNRPSFSDSRHLDVR